MTTYPQGTVAHHELVELIPALRAFARSLCRNSDEADDLVQETLMKALANLDKFERGTRLKSWLFTIMRNTFLTRRRTSGRESVGIEDCVSQMPQIPADQEGRLRLADVRRALARLPQHHREIIVLVVMLGERYEDAALICDCAVGTVKSRLFRARQRLQVELGEPAELANSLP